MEILSNHPSLSLQVPLAGAPALVRAWQTGQVLDATVIRVLPESKTVVLQMTEGEVEAHSELPLRPGMRLQLTAEPRGNQWQLRLTNPRPPAQETVAAALRQALPRAAPLAPVFEAIERLVQQPPQALPERIRVAAETVLQARPTPERLREPSGLRAALQNSGVLLESRLADPAAPPPTADLKARLLTLWLALSSPPAEPKSPRAPVASPSTTPAATAPQTPSGKPPADLPVPPEPPASDPIKPLASQPLPPPSAAPMREPRADAPPAEKPPLTKTTSAPAPEERDRALPDGDQDFLFELLRKVEGALSRIQLHQLRALPDGPQEPQWVFELPVRTEQGADTLLLRFEREAERETGSEAAQRGWRVTLDLSHPGCGALRAVVNWQGGEITTRFFAERAATAELFRRHLPDLAASLSRAGITVGAIEAHTGIPADGARASTSGILSERA